MPSLILTFRTILIGLGLMATVVAASAQQVPASAPPVDLPFDALGCTNDYLMLSVIEMRDQGDEVAFQKAVEQYGCKTFPAGTLVYRLLEGSYAGLSLVRPKGQTQSFWIETARLGYP